MQYYHNGVFIHLLNIITHVYKVANFEVVFGAVAVLNSLCCVLISVLTTEG